MLSGFFSLFAIFFMKLWGVAGEDLMKTCSTPALDSIMPGPQRQFNEYIHSTLQ
jgi:hypothetical protein